ncbi:MAG: M12 family metallo-peptidase [Phycisphaerales bacterium]|nr:M12 family metallo-peptidase [Phycisphaerales bacterium]
MFLPFLSLTLAATTMTDGTPPPILDRMDSPIVRTNQPSPWRAFSASTVSSDLAGFDAIARRSRDSGQDVLVEQVPLGLDVTVNLVLRESRSITPDSRFVLASLEADGSVTEVDLPAPTIVVLTGHVEGEPDSDAMLAQGDMGTTGYVRLGERTFLVSSGPQGSDQPILSFEADLMPEAALELAPVACTLLEIDGHAGGTENSDEGGLAGGGTLPCRKVGFAIETDEEYLDMFASQNAANAYASLLVTASSEIYQEQFNTYLEIDYIRLWSTTDPWTSSNTSSQLTEFREYWESNMGSVERDLAHFLSGRGLGGGVAWLGGLCGGSYAYALSANLNGFFPYPIQDNSSQNWDLMVFSHETGHSFGTGHTHDSYNPPIDGCGNNDCSVIPNGTIMSYCHLCSGGIANMRMIFHPRVEEVVLDYLDSISCSYTGAGEGAVAADDEYAIDINEIVVLDALVNDIALSCGAISVIDHDTTTDGGALVELIPAQGTNGRDRFRYTPQDGFTGADSFDYTIADDSGNQSSAVVTVTVATNVYFNISGGELDVIYAEGQPVTVTIITAGVTVDPSTCTLTVNDGTGAQTVPMNANSPTSFSGTFPTLVCPGNADYSFSIQAVGGASYTSDLYSSNIGFELDDIPSGCCLTWSVSGDAEGPETGRWEIGAPCGTTTRGAPGTDFDGSGSCFLTGPGSCDANTDVDGGTTILTSKRFVADEDTRVTWAQWYDNTGSGTGADPGNDVFRAEITNDNGATWVLVEQVGPNDSQSSGGWFEKQIMVVDYVTPTTLCKMRWIAEDAASGSVIEAAIDAFGAGSCVPPDQLLGDLNGDGQVDGQDLSVLLGNWGTSGNGDINEDGIVNGSDLAALLGNWTG